MLQIFSQRHLMLADSIRDKFGNKTGSCKVNAARQAKHIEYMSRMDGRTCNIKQKCVKSQTPRQAKRGRDTKIPQSGGPPEKVGDEAVHKELGDRMERAATTASSLEAEQDSEGSEDFHQIIDFLNLSHIKNGDPIDGRVKTITEASIRRHLKLEDSDGIPTLPNAKIFEQLALMGYASDSDKLTFQKGHFSPQWRFLIHTILHCLSPKKTAWEQFSSNIATAIICLATNRTFNFSKMIFEGMLKNLDSRGDIPLFLTMLTTPESSPSRITSSPSLSPQTHPSTSQQPPTPPFMQTIHDAEEPATMPYDLSQPRVQSLGNDKGSLTLNELMVLCTTLSKMVEDLQNDLKQTKLTYRAAYTKLILRVKKLEHKKGLTYWINQNPSIFQIVQDEGTSWIQEDAETLWRTSADTKILLELEEPTELVEDPGSGEKGEKEISTAEVLVSSTHAIPEVSTAILERHVYIKRSAEKRKDKGKAIMKDDESVQEERHEAN
ncbi:hypothetical protein Tco_0447971 [Tanacetum coccineum]